ncbi:MAG: hypothetical protein AMXMBFR58_29440 [Phycisphaerae bacterium]
MGPTPGWRPPRDVPRRKVNPWRARAYQGLAAAFKEAGLKVPTIEELNAMRLSEIVTKTLEAQHAARRSSGLFDSSN